ncbi:hypothetical protein D3C71_1922110 [compost metagenome]
MVEQAGLAPWPDDFGVAQELEDAVREGRRTGTPARKGQDDEVFPAGGKLGAREEAIAGVLVCLGNRRVDRPARTTAQQEGQAGQEPERKCQPYGGRGGGHGGCHP